MHENVKLRAQAKVAGIPNYRNLSVTELQAALKKAKASSAPEASSDNGATASKRKSAATSGTSKRKSASGRKAANAKTAPAESATSGRKAKRQSTGGRKSATTRAKAKANRKATSRKATTQRATPNARKPKAGVGRMAIDNSKIDWQAEWGGGQSGNRGTIMKLLRRHKGDVEKVWQALADKAQSMYPKMQNGKARPKEGPQSARALLSWHINRIKFDFVTQTGQHQGYTRSKAKATQSRSPGSARKSTVRRPASRKAGAQRRGAGNTRRRKSTSGRKR